MIWHIKGNSPPSFLWNHVVKILANTYCLNIPILHANNFNCVRVLFFCSTCGAWEKNFPKVKVNTFIDLIKDCVLFCSVLCPDMSPYVMCFFLTLALITTINYLISSNVVQQVTLTLNWNMYFTLTLKPFLKHQRSPLAVLFNWMQYL